MWNLKANVRPVVTGTTGSFPKSLRKYLSNVQGEQEITKLQKSAILGIAHKLREVVMSMYKTHFRGEITLHVAQIVNTEQFATLYTLETWFVSAIYSK
jgi:flagellar hook-basal body complex protein FliE